MSVSVFVSVSVSVTVLVSVIESVLLAEASVIGKLEGAVGGYGAALGLAVLEVSVDFSAVDGVRDDCLRVVAFRLYRTRPIQQPRSRYLLWTRPTWCLYV